MNTTDHVFEKPTSQGSQGVLPRRLLNANLLRRWVAEWGDGGRRREEQSEPPWRLAPS